MVNGSWIALPSGQVASVTGDRWLDEPTGTPVMRGLARNPAAPVDVLLRLLREHDDAVPAALRRRADLPEPVIEAMLRHPAARVRGALAAARHLDPAVRLRLVDDADDRVLGLLREDRSLPLPDHVFALHLDRLARVATRLMTPDELAGEVFDDAAMNRYALGAAVRHADPGIREAAAAAVRKSGEVLGEATIRELLGDDEADAWLAERDAAVGPGYRGGNGYEYRATYLHRRLSRALVDKLLLRDSVYDLECIVKNPSVPLDVAGRLIEHPEPDVRRSLAERDDLTAAQLARLAADPDVRVRTAVSVHPALTEQQRAAIDIEVELCCVDRRAPSLPAVEQSVAWSRSVNPLLRRRAAQDHRTPAEVAAALAEDPDPGVRVLLAHRHPAAPPALLLRAYREHPRCSRGVLPLLPHFPRVGLARLAEDADAGVRRLVALDPAAPPTVVEGLLDDPDHDVRHAMAQCPRLPGDRIEALLTDGDLAEAAAANPALPAARMRELIDCKPYVRTV
ncbi:hypothetical protein [Actinoplanes sp. NPDC049681]|uniref:hypothetical protein n=1 Tax=Actinoplanes sp. NPDC049681 TaxID=3363905 RepID=UPI00379B9EC2